MKKILVSLSILLLMSGCNEETKTLSCSNTSEANGIVTKTKYDIKYMDDEVKHVTITYDYSQNNTMNNDVDGTNADTDGLDQNKENNTTTNDNNLQSDEVIDGVVGDAIDSTINGVKDTILDLAGIKNNYQNQMSTFDNMEGFSYKVDVDNDNEYKVIYDIDMDKISDNDLARFNIGRDYSNIKSNYSDLGYTCE